ncbi:MAG TPA: SDR family NAD(P)-dependent oxidoreductase [Terriglobales bacterium]|nr:SDR family NAD(P)-dependent oxidoreductase [Terriglobales bacterium]
MNWKSQSVLVTGAGGFIGSHLAEALVRSGARTRALVHYNSAGREGWLEHSEYRSDLDVVAGDIREVDSVIGALKGVDIVFHLAALIAIPYSYRSPSSYVSTNIVGTLNILQEALRANVSRLVHTSTSEVYGSAKTIPISEKHPLQGQSPYSATKIGADKLAESFHRSFGLPVSIVRPFNTYGPRQSARAVIPTIMTQALSHEPIRIGNTTPTRDFNFVEDTVRGFIQNAESEGSVGQVINLGTGTETSIGELARIICSLAGCECHIVQEPQRIRPVDSEVDRLLADNRVAEQVLGWRPEVRLQDGLKQTMNWVRDNLKSYRPEVYTV